MQHLNFRHFNIPLYSISYITWFCSTHFRRPNARLMTWILLFVCRLYITIIIIVVVVAAVVVVVVVILLLFTLVVWHFYVYCVTIRYDTIRDVSLTCARKPTRISLIYRKETTTKKCKTEKLKTDMLRSNSKQSGESMWSVLKKKRKGCSWKDLQRRKVLSLEWKSEWVMEN